MSPARSAIRWKLLTAGERTESAGLVIGIAEIPPGERLLLHHHGAGRDLLHRAGRGRMEIDDRAADVGPGYAAYIPPNAKHTLRCGARGRVTAMATDKSKMKG